MEYIVGANHQVEYKGRMYRPKQVVPGVNKKDPQDKVLIDEGLLVEVKGEAQQEQEEQKSPTPPPPKNTTSQTSDQKKPSTQEPEAQAQGEKQKENK